MPSNPTDLLQQALALDAAGKESRAIPLYRKALASRLPPDLQHTALVSLASSLRTIGDAKAAIRVLHKARRLFPRDTTITLFLALTHADLDQYPLALRQLADGLLKESTNPRLPAFRKSLATKFHSLRPPKNRPPR